MEQFIPPKTSEFLTITLRFALWGCRAKLSSEQRGSSRLRIGGIVCVLRVRRAIAASKGPAPATRCPTCPLIAVITGLRSVEFPVIYTISSGAISLNLSKSLSAARILLMVLDSAWSPLGVEVAWQLKQSISAGVSPAPTNASYIAATNPTPLSVGLSA